MGVPRSTVAVAFSLATLSVCLVVVAPYRFFVDDAWFYLEIANRMAQGQGSTFNGQMPTNGYHPLWLGVSSLISVATGTSRPLAPTATVLFQGLVLGLPMLWLVARITRQASLPYPTLPLALVGGAFYASPWYGSEAWLNGLTQLGALSALLWAHARTGAPGASGRWLLCGALFGLAVLARLDLVFLAGAAILTVPFHAPTNRQRVADTASFVTGCSLIVAPYLLLNLWTTGHPVPISGSTKGTFPVLQLESIGHKLGDAGQYLGFGTLVGALVSTRVTGPARILLGVTAVGGLAQVLYVALFTRWGWSTDQGYYYITALLCVAFSASILMERYSQLLPSLDARARQRLATLLVLAVAVVVPLRVARNVVELHQGHLQRVPDDPVISLARSMSRSLPAGAVVYTFDAPGRLAWFSGLPVIAADGLTADYGYDQALRDPDLEAFLRRSGVQAVILPIEDYLTPWGRAEVSDGSVIIHAVGPRSGEPAGVLALPLQNAVVTTAELSDQVDGLPAALFRWPAP